MIGHVRYKMITSYFALMAILFFSLLQAAVKVRGSSYSRHVDRLTIRPDAAVITKRLGGSVVLTCLARQVPGDNSNEPTELRWIDPSGQVILDRTGRRRYIEAENSDVIKLYITNISPAEEGAYRCSARIGGRNYEKTTTIELYKDITFETAPSPQYLRANVTGLIRCVVSGRPAPVVTWRFNNARIVPGGRYTVTDDGLLIDYVTPELDAGVYSCRGSVEDDGRYEERNIDVEVHEPPQMIEGPGNVEGLEGGEATVTCRATGKPSPSFIFYMDGMLMTSSDVNNSRVQLEVEDSGVGRLRFRQLTKADHGLYRCVASNTVGSVFADGKLTVRVKPKVVAFASEIIQESSTATLVCIVTGEPLPHITFKKAGQDSVYRYGDNGRTVLRVTARGRAELTLRDVSANDTSEYTCTARNVVGDDHATASLTVIYPPRRDVNQLSVDYIWADVTRNISCTVHGQPQPTFQWSRFGHAITGNDTFQVFNDGPTSYLQIHVRPFDQAWIYGNYRCTATSPLGRVNVDIDVRRASVPDVPKTIEVLAAMPDVVELRIGNPDDDGGVPVDGYRVQHDSVIEDFSSTDGKVRLTNLSPRTSYLLRVRVRNAVGYSSPVEIRVGTTNVERPLPVVITSPTTSDQPFDYRVTWSMRSTGGRPVDRYQFQYRRIFTDDHGNEQAEQWTVLNKWMESHSSDGADVDDEASYHVLSKLVPNSRYELIMRAHNEVNWSNDTPPFEFQTAPASAHALPNSAVSTAWSRHARGGSVATSAAILALTLISLLCRSVTNRTS